MIPNRIPNFRLIVLFLLNIYALNAKQEEFEKPDTKMYFAIAALPNQTYSRIFNKTLANFTQTYLNKKRSNIIVDTLTIDLPENGSFTADFLENLCEKFEKKHVVAVLVIGDSPAAFTVNVAASHIGFPVLWAKGHSELLPGFRSLATRPLEIQLAPSGRELVSALRGLLLHAHWHTFTLLADPQSATALRGPELWPILRAQPLHPNLITLSTPLRAQSLFRKLADISRSTRGVVVLLSDKPSAIRILEDAKRLNMMDGHFVWMWIDTSANISFRNSTDDEKEKDPKDSKKDIEERLKRSVSMVDLHQANINYMLRNDKFLLLNKGKQNQQENRSKARNANDKPLKTPNIDNNVKSDLPPGLLHLRPLPIKIDRHLIKGAVRLLATALKTVLNNVSNDILSGTKRRFSTSCWRPLGEIERNLSHIFGRELNIACTSALAGRKFTQEIGVDKVDKSLVANFEILNLVLDRNLKDSETFFNIEQNRSEINLNTTYIVKWKRVGLVSGSSVRLDTIVWPGGDLSVAAVSSRARTAFRVVTALSPPFVMESELDEDGQCLRGLPCHRVLTSDKDNLTLVFNEMRRLEDEEDDKEEAMEENKSNPDYKQFNVEYDDERENFPPFQKFKYRTNCCYGLAMDLLENIAQELEFDFRLYIVADGLYGSKSMIKKHRQKRDIRQKFLNFRLDKPEAHKDEDEDDGSVDKKWNGIVGDIVSGAAHMSFAALSVSSARSEVIDFSAPYFYGGVSFMASPQQKSEIPLLAFLLPFSPELWIAIFTSLNITAIAVAIYEWLSPFGLNPWGRQRSKNFSMSSALWVMWGLLCGHLVAFKAPKSWPNKFLINVWGGFSVIFVASYTANIAALIAGLFFQNTVSNYHDRGLLNQKVGAPKSSAAEYYVQKTNPHLWHHMHRYALSTIEEGIDRLRNGSLDLIIADTSVLDYYRATDHGCKLQKIGDDIIEDTYAIGMSKGFPLKDSISAVISKYSNNGYMDILQEKWYGGLPCFKLATDIVQPRPLGVRAVTGVFILLGVGMTLGLVILLLEHLFFRYTLPLLREKPKGSVWRSRNIMFFSQKLYRFINCVELVSPHHAARELVHTIRQGQITSLFQKSIKRKEHEQRRRRKSKAQFFEMIQEIRSTLRRQQEEREPQLESVTEVDSEEHSSPDEKKSKLSPNLIKRTFMRSSPKNDGNRIKSPTSYFSRHQLFSPRSRNKTKSFTNLNVRRFSTDSILNSPSAIAERSSLVGRRLSRDATSFLTSSPPDINSRRSSYLDVINSGSKLSVKSPVLSIENVSDSSSKSVEPIRKLSDSESIGRKLATLPKYKESVEKQLLIPQNSFTMGSSDKVTTTTIEVPQVTTARSFTNLAEPRCQQKAFSDEECTNNKNQLNPRQLIDRRLSAPKMENKPALSDEEITRRNNQTISQLRKELYNRNPTSEKLKENKTSKDNNFAKNLTNPLIKIQIDDTSMECAPNMSKRHRMRHKSLGEVLAPEINKAKHVPEQSQSLDSNPKQLVKQERIQELNDVKITGNHERKDKSRQKFNKRESSSLESGGAEEYSKPRRIHKKDFLSFEDLDHNMKSPKRPTTLEKSGSLSPESKIFTKEPHKSRKKRSSLSPDKKLDKHSKESRPGRARRQDDPLPPAPPPPNCSPRNSNGRSPLERLSKDELVLLWRSSESELRSHLLKAIRDKGEENKPP